MTSTRLEAETHIVTGAHTSGQNVIKRVHQAGFDREEVVSQGLAAWQAVLSPNEMELGAGLVVTGGSARLLGTIDAAGKIFNSSVRLGLPQGVGGLADRVSGPSFATGVGLVRWGSKLQPVTNGKHLNGGNVTATYQKSVRWLRDFF